MKAAFTHEAIPGESPVAYFSGQHRPKKERRKAGRKHTVHATASRPPKFSHPNLVGRQLLTGKIHRLVAELDPLEFLWVHFRYRAPGVARSDLGHKFLREYFRAYEGVHLVGCKAGTRRMVRYLISIAMQDDLHPRRDVAPDGGDVDRRNWNKTYRPHWHRVCLGIEELDACALEKIGQKLIAGSAVA